MHKLYTRFMFTNVSSPSDEVGTAVLFQRRWGNTFPIMWALKNHQLSLSCSHNNALLYIKLNAINICLSVIAAVDEDTIYAHSKEE